MEAGVSGETSCNGHNVERKSESAGGISAIQRVASKNRKMLSPSNPDPGAHKRRQLVGAAL